MQVGCILRWAVAQWRWGCIEILRLACPGLRAATMTIESILSASSGWCCNTVPTFVTGPMAMMCIGPSRRAATSALVASVATPSSSGPLAPLWTGIPAGPNRTTTSVASGCVISSDSFPKTELIATDGGGSEDGGSAGSGAGQPAQHAGVIISPRSPLTYETPLTFRRGSLNACTSARPSSTSPPVVMEVSVSIHLAQATCCQRLLWKSSWGATWPYTSWIAPAAAETRAAGFGAPRTCDASACRRRRAGRAMRLQRAADSLRRCMGRRRRRGTAAVGESGRRHCTTTPA